MDTTPRTHSDSIHVRVAPDELYAIVSDVTRTGEWSPICQECWWDAGEGPQVGAWFTGRNVVPERTWETRSQVVAADPGREFAWSVGKGYARWGFHLEPGDEPGTTTLTESWEFTRAGLEVFIERYGDDAPNQVENRTTAARTGIPATLAAIKKIAEAE
ncbi:polyketide cyclase/dehydrase/lipid transport protein [Nocardioides albertanoniae]|uniref:Polyketide cyclase/dehydrase/lipid transport protein n=1 Tax=Nocardioides albertanoniae TaxID=1175486 RepID=A0A543A5D0_9ACTN|nr:SRPBCC family protein [Nocardioides albertanoniae]TQL67799.1 polyketide cyclase/dehydrase/lipid transport protein [Nocardioides albertanoniae]